MPQISIIVPVYKVEPYIRRCVDSILAQTFTDFELILVDDGSPDACGTICDEYAAGDSRIRVIHQENQGQAAARNHALDWVFEHSDSEYISFIDSDDWVHPRYLELLYKGIRQFHADFSQCRHLFTSDAVEFGQVNESISCISPEEEYKNYYSPYAWEKLYNREVWRSIRFPEGQIYEDLAIMYKVLFSQKRIAIVEAVLYYYYRNLNGTMRQDWHPGMLARMNAWDEQIAFFKKRGDKELLEAAVSHYCTVARREYNAIGRSGKLSDTEKNEYQTVLKKKMRRMMIRNSKEMKQNPKYKWFYKTAFPKHKAFVEWCIKKYEWCDWTARVIIRKIKQLLKS